MFTFPRVPFKLTNTPIDFFQLDEKLFSIDGFNYSKEEIRFDSKTRYLKGEKHFQNLDLEKKETVVLNFQVGKGKSSILSLIVGEYFALGYYILICSPYIKLIEKELNSVLDLFHKNTKRSKLAEILNWEVDDYSLGRDEVFFTHDYSKLDPHTDLPVVDNAVNIYPIHLLTINNLLGNPGEDRLYQSGYKQRYINNLLSQWKDEKVVFFFDEIHESTESFKSIFLPNIFRWQGIVKKIFVSSATFTPSSVPIIKALAFLTEKNISVYESERTKNSKQSSLSLHIMPSVYSYKTQYFLNHVGVLMQKYRDKKIPVNIITASKILAETIAKQFFGDNVITEKSKLIDNTSLEYINLCTSDTGIGFNDTQNNIGTTFKTGVNLANPNSVLIIIFPSILVETTYSNYGIFSDGVQSIIQTVGRMRNGGDIHLLISNPKSLIKHDYPEIIDGFVSKHDFASQNTSYDEVIKAYRERLDNFEKPVLDMERNLNKKSIVDITKKRNFGFWYPNQHEFLIEYSQMILLNHKNPSFGREIAPYVLWACINNQFANATLKNIYHIGSSQTMGLTPKNAERVFNKILSSKPNELSQLSFREVINNLGNILNSTGENNNVIPIKFSINNKNLTAAILINRYPSFVKAAIEQLFLIKFGYIFPPQNSAYIQLCLKDAMSNSLNANSSKLLLGYRSLNELNIDFLNWLKPNLITDKKNFHLNSDLKESLDFDFARRVKDCLLSIQELDFIFTSKAISFLQDLKDVPDSNLKSRVFEFLLKLTYEYKVTRKLIKGEKYKSISLLKQPELKSAKVL